MTRHGEKVRLLSAPAVANISLLALYVVIAALPATRGIATSLGAIFLILGCVAVAYESWRTSHPHRVGGRAWLFIALTYVTSAVAWVIASVLVATQGELPPSPHWIEIVFLSAYVFGTLGILHMGTETSRRGAGWARLLDGVVVTTALLLTLWTLVLSRILDIPGLSFAQRMGGLVFPFADLVLLTAVILLVARGRPSMNATVAYVCGAILLIIAADLFLWYVNVLQPTASQAAVPALFLGSTLLMMIGARSARNEPILPASPVAEGRRLVFLPYLPVAIAVGVAFPSVLDRGTIDAVTLVAGVVMLVAVLLRQYIALAENQRLARDAQAALRSAAVSAQEARLEELNHRHILDALDDIVCLVRRDGRIHSVSGAFGRLCGIEPDDAVGHRVSEYLEPLFAREGPIRFDVPIQREAILLASGGRRLHVELSVLDAQPPGAGPGGRIVIMRDITERRRVEAERASALQQQGKLERLEEMNRFKSSFLNMAAHELGTPLTPLRIQLHLLQQVGLDDPKRTSQSVKMIARNVDRLSDLVRDILDASRIQSSRIALRPQHVDLSALAKETVESYRVVADAAGIHLLLDAGESVRVVCDPARVAQVVLNFLSNAVKFTARDGAIRVIVNERVDGAALMVTDNGTGLSQSQMELLFKPFSQAHAPDPRRGGTGLGLYISRGIIEASGGHVWAESLGPGKGTTFGFVLPRETTQRVAPSVPASAPGHNGFAPTSDAPSSISTAATGLTSPPTQVAERF